MEYSFNLFNKLAGDGEAIALKKFIPIASRPPIILCIGSDLSIGDALGPISGTKIKERLEGFNIYVYGTLARPVTAHEVKYINDFLMLTHPNSPIIAIDAAVGNCGDVGLIKVVNHGINPGSGANKRLGKVGDVSIMGIVSEKSLFNYSIFSSTRLNMVYRMADIIADGVCNFIFDYAERNVNIS
jgi:putative sporulation protein YyaC